MTVKIADMKQLIGRRINLVRKTRHDGVTICSVVANNGTLLEHPDMDRGTKFLFLHKDSVFGCELPLQYITLFLRDITGIDNYEGRAHLYINDRNCARSNFVSNINAAIPGTKIPR